MPAASNPEQSVPPSATDRLTSVRAALDATTRKISELDQARNERLLADDNEGAIKLGIEIASLRLSARADVDKIALLREKAAEEDKARRAQEREALIQKIEVKIELRDRAMNEVAAAIKTLAAASERAINIGREVIEAWTWAPHDLPPALLTASAIMTAVSHEAFRVSYHPRRFGGADSDPLVGVSLPGSRSPTFQQAEDPARVRPMGDVVADASAFAKQFLRTGKGSAGNGGDNITSTMAPSTNGGGYVDNINIKQRSDAEQRLSALLRQMSKLAEDVTPAGEAEYLRVVGEVARVQAEVAAQQQMETQHHGR
jgi:hypothetical protein